MDGCTMQGKADRQDNNLVYFLLKRGERRGEREQNRTEQIYGRGSWVNYEFIYMVL